MPDNETFQLDMFFITVIFDFEEEMTADDVGVDTKLLYTEVLERVLFVVVAHLSQNGVISEQMRNEL